MDMQSNMELAQMEQRIQVLERQISMYERLFQTFSAKLDHHFKKYDLVINGQQQQIKALTDVLSTMLNDQCRSAGILRDKLGGALDGIVTTSASIRTMQSTGRGNSGSTPETSGNGSNKTNNNHNPSGSLPHDTRQNSGDANMTNVDALLGNFIPPHVSSDPPLDINAVTDHHNNSSPSEQAVPGHAEEQADENLKEEQYYTHKGRRKKRKVYIRKFEFHNSPQSVMDIWKEYTEGHNGQPSIKDMELMYQTSWRRDPAVNKRFHRRKVLCKAIERGLERGYDLHDVIRLLEDTRVVDASTNLKQPIGWLCQGSNIPDLLK
ncbi:HBL278Wp [Eremothecium sinecaudum]|uniref:HBL278Wp n=1 Tax=Eremothecium sinecaudum TaxID=45286 RepID=A0A109UW65_9SACH|nr:HBL278Wp [Eremothecium sinecaudum]AMD18624.1 HBL278Wp [Eremothecium sinecaudum]